MAKFSKIVGIGLPKTGTTTLGRALRTLGYREAPYDEGFLDAVLDGDRTGIPGWLERYDCFEDWPWPLVYGEVDAREPNAGFVLTVRENAGTWIESVARHAERNSDPRSVERRERIFGSADVRREAEVFVERYESHVREVRAHFADRPGRLLEVCWERGDGWEEICAFLGIRKPWRRFPRANAAPSRSRAAWWALRRPNSRR